MRKFLDPAGTLISETQPDGHVVVIETSDPRFEEWAATAAPYEPDMLAPDPAAALAVWREATSLSRLELARRLKDIGILTHQEAMAFVSYQPLPEPITNLIATLPEDCREDAEFEMQGGRDFPRSHPMWDLLCQSEGWPDESDVDTLFGWVND